MHTSRADLPYWLAALYLKGIGPVRFRRWLVHFGDIKTLFTASPQELAEAGLTSDHIKNILHPNWLPIEKDLAWSEKINCHLISCLDSRYPALLAEIYDAPLLLFVRGDVALLTKPQLAIVGSRNPTASGAELAEQFAYYLAKAGLAITSGLALGIDAASHQGALNAKGHTIAVCGTGLQYIYPASHQKLTQEIVEKGAVISEFLPLTPPKAKQFPMRNRVISGLSLGVLVIEAALRSGSLITARCSLEQGREVFALPGSIHNPLARGCHQLLRQGAKLVETAQDVLEELGTLKIAAMQVIEKTINLTESQQNVLTQIGFEITALDAIIMRSGLTTVEVSSMLLALELEGYIKTVPGGYIRSP